jgi:thymidine kinase
MGQVPHHELFTSSKLIIVDEAQFFPDLRDFVLYAVDACNKDVVIVGLDGDADRKPFGQILECMPLADEITKLKAFCRSCKDGTEALFTFCNQNKTEQVCVGGAEMYMPLCRKHYIAASGSHSSSDGDRKAMEGSASNCSHSNAEEGISVQERP